ncbi:MAG: carbamoyltransferase HypF, partial [Acidobacteriota bacterium]
LDARNDDAVTRLREKKPRREKPLALMARDLDQLRTLCEIDERELALLASPQAPIVLLRRRPDAPVADAVAPENPYLGVMLPYTPLHHLLLRRIDFPVVATSGNLSDEPICIDETEALVRLRGVAERFLIHDRPIERHVDDSVAWVWAGEPRIVRRARGYAPRPVLVRAEIPTVLAVGGHLKNAVALSMGRQVFVSQHIGDMETEQALAAFERVTADLIRLYEAEPVAVAHDMHPDYATTRWAQAAVRGVVADSTAALAREALPRLDGARLVAVQHHHAHLAACLAENGCDEPALGVTWDGTGYGPDGTVWGGEFLLGTTSSFRRVGHLRPFRLPGAEAAVREPRRSAVAVLWELGGRDALERDEPCPLEAFEPAARQPLLRMLEAGFNAPWTTSAGRLFDAVAALLGLHQTTTFEGQAAMALEFVASPSIGDAYPIDVTSSGAGEKEKLIVDWRPLIEALLEDRRKSEPASTIAARFHNALSCTIIDVARTVGVEKVALTGGCFQNQRLIVRTARALEKAGFTALLHRQIPPNDGGISLGQIAVAAARLAEG